MEVIAHQAVGVDLPFGLLTGVLQSGEKCLAIQVILENVLPAVSTIDDVVNRSQILHSQLAGHSKKAATTQPAVSIQTSKKCQQ
jgi:hypothetical protein